MLPKNSVGMHPKTFARFDRRITGQWRAAGDDYARTIRGRHWSQAREPSELRRTRHNHRGTVEQREQRFPCDVEFRVKWTAREQRPHDPKGHSENVLMRDGPKDRGISQFRAPHLLEHGGFALEECKRLGNTFHLAGRA